MLMIAKLAAVTVASALGGISLLHVYWGVGGRWPGSDEESLARTVVGGPEGMRMPSTLACHAVALVLATGTWVVLAAAGLLPSLFSPRLVQGLALLGAGILLLRGGGGFLDARFRPEIQGSRYARLNTRLFSPLCLGLSALLLVAVLG